MCAILCRQLLYRELHLASFLIFSITSPCHQDFRAVTLLIKLINSLHPNLSFFLPASVSCVRRELELLVLNQTGNYFGIVVVVNQTGNYFGIIVVVNQTGMYFRIISRNQLKSLVYQLSFVPSWEFRSSR